MVEVTKADNECSATKPQPTVEREHKMLPFLNKSASKAVFNHKQEPGPAKSRADQEIRVRIKSPYFGGSGAPKRTAGNV